MQRAIAEEHLDGWLFFHFRGRDPLCIRLLDLPQNAISTRPAFYLVPVSGEPRKIVHAIEPDVFDNLPGRKEIYASHERLLQLLASLPKGGVAVQYSEELPIVSFLDLGTARLLEGAGFSLVSSAALIQRTIGVLDKAGIDSHERACRALHEIVGIVWKRCSALLAAGKGVREDEMQTWIMEEFAARGLQTDHPPIVAAGIDTSDPHFEPPAGNGAPLRPGELLEIDLWAKEKVPGSIYGDISWVGFAGPKPPEEIERAFQILIGARDAGYRFIEEQFRAGAAVTGAQVDGVVRKVLIDAGFESALRHRTGHGIDVEDHGSGVNLDSVEFPDERFLIEGSCFSIEPGIYLPGYGLRTEINVYIHEGRPHISGGAPQERLLVASIGKVL
jgi:Xaa-Pro aminopeptidase